MLLFEMETTRRWDSSVKNTFGLLSLNICGTYVESDAVVAGEMQVYFSSVTITNGHTLIILPSYRLSLPRLALLNSVSNFLHVKSR